MLPTKLKIIEDLTYIESKMIWRQEKTINQLPAKFLEIISFYH